MKAIGVIVLTFILFYVLLDFEKTFGDYTPEEKTAFLVEKSIQVFPKACVKCDAQEKENKILLITLPDGTRFSAPPGVTQKAGRMLVDVYGDKMTKIYGGNSEMTKRQVVSVFLEMSAEFVLIVRRETLDKTLL